jgi:CheY-like chemotaxis protein
MRLDFNVLWVEDQQAEVLAQREELEQRLRKEGFRLQVAFVASVNDAKQLLSEDVFRDNIDLILMDYELGLGLKGDSGLKEVRATLPYKEIVFYSAQANNLRAILTASGVEGVYCATREELIETATGVFETLVKKVLDIDHSRGIVVGTTADIDHFINDSLVAVFKISDEKTQAQGFEIVKERMKEIRENFAKAADEIEAINQIGDLFDKHSVYTSSDRLRLLRKLLDANKAHEDKKAALKKYHSEIMPKRNTLAHVRVVRKGFARQLFDSKGNEFTSDEMKKLRVELLEHHEIFEKLYEALKS